LLHRRLRRRRLWRFGWLGAKQALDPAHEAGFSRRRLPLKARRTSAQPADVAAKAVAIAVSAASVVAVTAAAVAVAVKVAAVKVAAVKVAAVKVAARAALKAHVVKAHVVKAAPTAFAA
jgi:hypothetical protein